MDKHRQLWDNLASRLESLSPLSVLRRGYRVTRRADGQLVRSPSVHPGDLLITRLPTGEVSSRVDTVSKVQDT